MGLNLGDILLHFRAESASVDSAFARVDRQSADFARRAQDNLMARFTGDTSGLYAAASSSEGMLAGWSQRVKGYISQSMTMPVGNFISGMVGSLIGAVKGSVIGMNSSLEDSTLQFTTLMGSADLARAHVLDLFTFAKDTPFETGPVLQASRLLQTFGGNTLNSKKELLRLGDAAAVAGQGIERVGFWYGRMYSSIANKQPFGESAMAMQEMGVMSGETRIKLEAMQKAGADGAAVWEVFGKEMDKNSGAMLRMSTTWTGLKSTLADTVNISGAKVFASFFDLAKESLMMLVNILSTDRFNGFVEGAAKAMGGIADSIRTAAEGLLPIVAFVWGTIEPLLALAMEWGGGFVKAFADGISMAEGLVADALGGMADLITGLLEPHSPPKILPNLDTWGTKAAQVWMNGWGEADYGIFESIGGAVKSALELAVGKGAMPELSLVPVLAKTKAAIAELITGFEQTGYLSGKALDEMRKAAGPAGQAVADIAVAYLQVEASNRAVERSQNDLNAATKRYDDVLAPLNAQMAELDRQVSAINDSKKAADDQAKLANATGTDRELILIDLKQMALRRQIATQTQARDTAVKSAQAQIDAAKQDAAAAKTSLNVMMARQKVEEEGVAMAKQQVALLEKLTKGATGQAAASAEVKKSIDDANSAAKKMSDRVNGLIAKMGDFRDKGSAMVKPITDAFKALGRAWDNAVSGFKSNGLTGALVSLVSATGNVKALFTPMGQQLIHVTNAMKPFTDGLLVLPRTIRNAFSGFRSNGLTGMIVSLLADTGNLSAAFTPMGQKILAFTTSLPGRIHDIATAFGGVLVKLAAFGATTVFPALIAGLKLLAPLVDWVAGRIGLFVAQIGPNIENGVKVATAAIARLQALAGVIGTAWAAATQRFRETGNVGAAIKAFFGQLGSSISAGIPSLLAEGKKLAGGLIDGITKYLPAGLTAKLPLILGAVTALFAGFSLAPAIAGMFAGLAPVGALLAPLGLALGPILGLFGKIGPLFGRFLPVLGGLGPAFMSLLNPLKLLKGLGGGAFMGLIDMALALIGGAANPLGTFKSLLGGIIPMLLNLKNPIMLLLNVGKVILGFFSPLGIVIGLVALFAGAFATNFGGIQGIVQQTLGPIMPLLAGLAQVFGQVLEQLMSGNWSGAFSILQNGLTQLGPLLGGVATSFQAGIPAIFGVLMSFLSQIGTTVIGAIGTYLPGILTALAGMAAAFLGWIAPMIPPMLVAIGGMLGQLLDAIGAALPGIIETLATIAAQFVAWIQPMILPMLAMLAVMMGSILSWIIERAPGILAKLGEWGLQLIGWIAPMIPQLLVGLGTIEAAIWGWIIAAAPGILAKLGEWATQFSTWASTVAGPALLAALGTMFTGLWTELQRLWGLAFADGSLGKSLIDGLRQGIIDGWDAFSGWFVKKLTDMIPGWAKGPLGIPATPAEPPHKAGGGDVVKGTRYLVGEEGPEFFVAPSNGIIEPNSVYEAVTNPIASLGSALNTGTSRPGRATAGAAAAPTGASSAVAGGHTFNFELTLNNPVMDTADRAAALKAAIISEVMNMFTATINRHLLAGV